MASSEPSPFVPAAASAGRAGPSRPARQGFSWAGYVVACWVGMVSGGIAWGLGPMLVGLASDAIGGGSMASPARLGEVLAQFVPLIVVIASVLTLPAMLLLAPAALPLIATMHRSGLTRRRHAILGGWAAAGVLALFAALLDLAADGDAGGIAASAGHLFALIVLPGTLAGLAYRAIALRRSRRGG